MKPPEAVLNQLHDIDGLEPISWFPLATGWWLLIAGILFVLLVMMWWWQRTTTNRAVSARWQPAAREALRRVTLLPPAEQHAALAQVLRRIAMSRHGREACAGLQGQAWLTWLHDHDPHQFDWIAHGQDMVQYYSPHGVQPDAVTLDKLLTAARAWLD